MTKSQQLTLLPNGPACGYCGRTCDLTEADGYRCARCSPLLADVRIEADFRRFCRLAARGGAA